MSQQVVFTNPRTAASYTWPHNPPPDGIQGSQKQIQITRTSNTANVGATRQQGDDGPYIIHWEVLVFVQSHEVALWEWYVLSRRQSIYMTDFNGEQFEGQIITLGRQQIGALGGPGETNLRGFYCKYVFEFECWRAISGVLADAGVVM